MRIGTLIDRLYKKKLEMEAVKATADKLKVEYNVIEIAIFDEYANQDIKGATGKLAKASLSSLVYPTLKDYTDLERFIYRNKALDLLQKRVAKANWLDRLEARKGRPIPGVTTFEKINLNLRKI